MNTTIKVNAIKKGLILTRNLIVKQSPIILTVAGVTGVLTTIGLTVKATTKAKQLIEEKKIQEGMNIDEKLTVTETVKTAWKPFVPVALSAGLTIGAIIGSSAINEKRKAALAGLYALSETALQEYQEKTEEMAGKSVADKIKDHINAEKVQDDVCPFEPDEFVVGKCLVKDRLSGRVFLSSMEEIRRAANDINEGILGGDMLASLNDFYNIIGLDEMDLGVECGWNLERLCHPYFTSSITSDGRPILVLDWDKNGRPISTYRDI